MNQFQQTETNLCQSCPPSVNWQEANPLTGSRFEADTTGGGTLQERDPTGANTGTEDLYQFQSEPGFLDLVQPEQLLFIDGGSDPFNPGKCEKDGMAYDCDQLDRDVDNGAVGGDVYRNGRYIGYTDILGSGSVGGRHFALAYLPDEFSEDLSPTNGDLATVNIRAGAAYFIEVAVNGNASQSGQQQTQQCEPGKPCPQKRPTPTPRPTPAYPNCYTFYELIYNNKDVQEIINNLWSDTGSMAAHFEANRSGSNKWIGGELGGVLFFDESRYQIQFRQYTGYEPAKSGEPPHLPGNYLQQLEQFKKDVTATGWSGRILLAIHTHPPDDNETESYSKRASGPDLEDITRSAYGSGPLFGIVIYGKGKFKVYGRGKDDEETLKRTCIKNKP